MTTTKQGDQRDTDRPAHQCLVSSNLLSLSRPHLFTVHVNQSIDEVTAFVIQWLLQAQHRCTEERVLNLRVFGGTFIIQTVSHNYLRLVAWSKIIQGPRDLCQACPTQPLGDCPMSPPLCLTMLLSLLASMCSHLRATFPCGPSHLLQVIAQSHICWTQPPVPHSQHPLFLTHPSFTLSCCSLVDVLCNFFIMFIVCFPPLTASERLSIRAGGQARKMKAS